MKLHAGLRLKAARLVLGIDRQDTMATVLGVQRSAYNNWEKGVRLPDVAAMVRLLAKSGVSLDWIFAGELRSMPFDLASKLEEQARELGAAISVPAGMTAESQDARRTLVAGRPKLPRVLHERQGGIEQ